MHDLVAHRLPREIVETIAGAMRWDQVIRVDRFKCCDGFLDVVIAKRRNDMEAADHRVHLVDTGRLLRRLDRVDDAAMTA